MVAIALALLVAAGCLTVSYRRLRTLPAVGSGDVEQAVTQLRRTPTRERALHLLAQLPEQSEAADLLQNVLQATTREHAVAEINLQLSEVSRQISVGAEVPMAAARIAFASGTVLALILVATGLSDTDTLVQALVVFGACLLVGLICAQMGRLAGRRATRYRESWNAFGQRLMELWDRDTSATKLM